MTIINDVGKDPSLAEEVCEITGLRPESINHDQVVFEAAQASLLPCVQRLGNKAKKEVFLGLKLGSTFNAAQLAQAENVPGSLEGLLEMKGSQHAVELKMAELILDVAGAAGHSDARCAKTMTEPVARSYLATYEAVMDIVQGRCTLREGYDKVLSRHAHRLAEKGFKWLSVENLQERSLLRMILMSRIADANQAWDFLRAYNNLPLDIKTKLSNGLNVDGHWNGTAILLYYMPAVFSEGLKDVSNDMKLEAVSSIMRFVARMVGHTKPMPGQKGSIVERNVKFALDTVQSDAFKEDPAILDKLDLPLV